MTTRLNIAAISRRTGVAPDTLRKWEARYHVLQPERTPGGQRRYGERDVARVEWLRDRIAEGWRIGEAARLLEETTAPALDDPAELRAALQEAVGSEDPGRVGAILDQTFAVLAVEDSLDEVVVPALRWVGDEWNAGRLSVAHEHLLTAQVRARLEQRMTDRRGSARGTAVLACAPGEQHELGLLMLAVLLRADGWHVEYLGADTPVDDAVAYAAGVGASFVCFSASRRDTATALRRELRGLDGSAGPALVVGGPGVRASDLRGLGALHSPERLGDAVLWLRRLAA